MKNDDAIGWKNQIECQRDALRWVTLSFVNYFFFYIVVLIFTSLNSNDKTIRKCRFIYAVFIAFVIIPYMLGLNIAGRWVFKDQYFDNVGQNKGNIEHMIKG